MRSFLRSAASVSVMAAVPLMFGAGAQGPATLRVPPLAGAVTPDGSLDEPCYAANTPLTAFVDAADPKAPVPATRAWAFWSDDGLTVAFDCNDPSPAAAAPSGDEKDVDPQDRVELFLWSGKEGAPYYCVEIAAKGAIHDYKARFYRKFDDGWSPEGLVAKASAKKGGYAVEAFFPRRALEAMGFPLRPGSTWRAGLFRADFDRLGGTPTWITWVDPRTEKPDFHVAGAFGTFELTGR